MPDTADAGRIMAQAVQDGFISPSNRAMLSARLGPEGNAAFDGWLQERGITTQEQPAMDETEYEDDTDEAALPSFGAGGADQFAVMYQQGMSALQRATAAEADARRQAFENAQRHIEQNSFGAPSRSEQLMRISQALLSRRDSRGIAGTLGNLVPALAQSQTDTREAGEQRAAALAQLQQQYATGTASAATASARDYLTALGPLRPREQPRPRAAYDADDNMWSQEGAPVRVPDEDNILADGSVFAAYNLPDGTRVYRGIANGQQVTVDEQGRPVSTQWGQQ